MKEFENPARAEFSLRYFKTGPGEYGEGEKFLGIAVPALRKLSHEFDQLAMNDIQILMRSHLHEERAIALMILVRQFQKGDSARQKKIHNFYLKHTRYINNWDLVDCSAEHIVGGFLLDGDRTLLDRLAHSKSLWERRIAVLSTYHFIRKGEFDDLFRVAGILLTDREDLIHKAVGWMLREIGKRDPKAEENFLRKHYRMMPRTMLRYAIEKFPEKKRQSYLRGLIKT